MTSRHSTIQYLLRAALILLLAAASLPATDVWDQASPNDDTPANTRNALIPGDPAQRHDVQAKAGPTADQDWYRLVVAAGHSYEVRVGARQEDCFDFTGQSFRVLGSDAMTEITTGTDYPGTQAPEPGSSYRATFVAPTNEVVFVQLVGDSSCGAASEYTIQLFDTTLLSPFFSTAGGFESFYRMLNTTNFSIEGDLTFFNSVGTVLATVEVTIPAGGSSPTFNTGPSSFNIADGQAGPVRFTHTGPPGGILIDAFAGIFGATTAVLPLKFERAQ